jgi:hypothetical protein
MTTDSVVQLIKYQQSIGAVPKGASFSVRTNWGGPLSSFSGSLRKYVEAYKGAVTYITLIGRKPASPAVIGTLADLLNGGNADDASQSASWNAIMNGIKDAFNAANGSGFGVSMQNFDILDPASNVSNFNDLVDIVTKLLLEAFTHNSVTASGTFKLDIQTGGANLDPFHFHIPPPDPRPVFNWSITISVDNNAHSITLEIDVTYNHMESDSLVRELSEFFLGVLSDGLLGAGTGIILGVGAVAVDQVVTQKFNEAANNALMNFFGGPWSKKPWVVQPIQVQAKHPNDKEFTLSVTYQVDSSAWNELANLINNIDNFPTLSNAFGPSLTLAG